MAMINMKQAPEREEKPGEVEMDEPKYPYGLCINLDKDQLDKLGITALPQVGATMMITAKAYVKSTSAYETQGGKDMSIGLQITDMEIGAAKTQSDQASMLYGEG
jgi:hypothetical protein